jgi:hypothetical protein
MTVSVCFILLGTHGGRFGPSFLLQDVPDFVVRE